VSESFTIPADMIDREASAKAGCTVVSIRDMLVALGATDEQLRDHDERQEILEREPWRRDGLKRILCGKPVNGMQLFYMTGEIDWSGTRFDTRHLG
jgi:hypothetical protein